jgi:hypothetical protein
MVLQYYIEDTQALLHDTSGLFTPVQQLTRWINQARRQVAYRTGCLRILVNGNAAFGTSAQPGVMTPGPALPGQTAPGISPFPVFKSIAGVERYPYGYANPYVKAQNAGVKGIIDVFTVSTSWGGNRPTLAWLPWDELQAYARSYNFGVTSYPFYWSTFGDGESGEVWLFPIPSTSQEMEWDCTCVPIDIFTDNDPEAIPEGFRNAVKYYAAHLAYVGSQRPAYSQMMLQAFQETLGISRVASDRGKVPDYYWWNSVY